MTAPNPTSWAEIEQLISRIQRQTAPPRQILQRYRPELQQNVAMKLPGRLKLQTPVSGPLNAVR